MIPNHATQTDPYLHECKGAATAPAGHVNTANGDGTASFQAPQTGGAGAVIKTATAVSTYLLTGTTLIPFDNTIPQITEGTNVFSIVFTPTYDTSKIRVEIKLFGGYSVAAVVTTALFKDGAADAIAAASVQGTVSNQAISSDLVYEFVSGSVAAMTLDVQVGGSTAGTYTSNGNAGAGIFGGVAVSSVVITEIKV